MTVDNSAGKGTSGVNNFGSLCVHVNLLPKLSNPEDKDYQ
jgi:hypothetical protein